MKEILPTLEHAKVMVVGDVMLDRYWYGHTNRISPEAPVPIVKIDTIKEFPGGAANVAMNVASLGAHSYLVGLIGSDNASHTIKKALSDVNVRYSFVSVPTRQTIIKLRVFSHNQQLIRLDFEENFEDINLQLLYEYISKKISNVGVLVLSDYAKGSLSDVQKIIHLADKVSVPVLVDPKSGDFWRYRGAMLLTPNLSEFEKVVGKCKNENEIIEHGKKIISDCKLSALLVTLSEQGMILIQSGEKPLKIPQRVKKVCDSIGAGDTVISVIAATLAAGSSLKEACYFASTAAGVVLKKIGTSTVSFSELKNAVHTFTRRRFGIINEYELKKAINVARMCGEKIVMTNGVFDILHAGHVAYLEKACKLGDRLIVAVNSDASTRRLKGHTRPINSLEKRMIVLNALKSVDWVISFEEDTPKRLISSILPDVLVKGGDYQLEEIVGSKEVLENGGKVVAVNFESSCSSTKCIQKILTRINQPNLLEHSIDRKKKE